MSRILVTGVAGFIGSHLAEALLAEGHWVLGIDNFDPFYPRAVKEDNLSTFISHPSFRFQEMDICDKEAVNALPSEIDVVMHLAAKAGVRPSIEAPDEYLHTNVEGTQNIMNWMVAAGIDKLLFAGSSSVYGNNEKIPFSETDSVDFPISPYAYTKKAGELLIHSYHHLYKISALCLRFFTVYGPRQRPDLAIHKFTRLIMDNKPITMYGDGSTARDYTYIADTVQGILKALHYITTSPSPIYEIFNLGNNKPVKLRTLIEAIFDATGRKAEIHQLAMQPGDVDITFADIQKAVQKLGYSPETNLEDGLKSFIEWYESKRK